MESRDPRHDEDDFDDPSLADDQPEEDLLLDDPEHADEEDEDELE